MGPGNFLTDPISAISFGMALMFGTAGLPHILMRFFTVPDARQARISVLWATGWIGYFYILTFIIGFGAIVLVGTNPAWVDAAGALRSGNMAAIHLAEAIGGNLFLGFVSAVAFATILAVVAGLTLSGASAVSHDLYATVFRKGEAEVATRSCASRACTVVVLALLAILLGIAFEKINVAFMVGLAFALAASGNFPVLILSLFWKGCTTRGVVAGGIGGRGAGARPDHPVASRSGSTILGNASAALPLYLARNLLDAGRLLHDLDRVAARPQPARGGGPGRLSPPAVRVGDGHRRGGRLARTRKGRSLPRRRARSAAHSWRVTASTKRGSAASFGGKIAAMPSKASRIGAGAAPSPPPADRRPRRPRPHRSRPLCQRIQAATASASASIPCPALQPRGDRREQALRQLLRAVHRDLAGAVLRAPGWRSAPSRRRDRRRCRGPAAATGSSPPRPTSASTKRRPAGSATNSWTKVMPASPPR